MKTITTTRATRRTIPPITATTTIQIGKEEEELPDGLELGTDWVPGSPTRISDCPLRIARLVVEIKLHAIRDGVILYMEAMLFTMTSHA